MEVRDYIALADNLCTERAAFEGGWDEMRRIIMPSPPRFYMVSPSLAYRGACRIPAGKLILLSEGS